MATWQMKIDITGHHKHIISCPLPLVTFYVGDFHDGEVGGGRGGGTWAHGTFTFTSEETVFYRVHMCLFNS